MASSITNGQPPRRRWLIAGAGMIAALLSTHIALAESPPGQPVATAAAASTAPVPAAPSASAAADAPAPGPVERAHRAYAERPSTRAFNPRVPRVGWDERWPKAGAPEMVTTGAAAVLVFASRAIPPQPSNWRDVSPLDAAARSAIRLGTAAERNTADDASDLLLTLMVNQLIVDATLVAWWGHDRPSVGYQLALIDLEALALTGGLQALVSALVSRWRPFRDTCVGPRESQTRDCQENKQYTSFWSGHTSGAFTVAGLMCMHHAYLPLYGGGAAEPLTCATAVAAAATVGYLRMAADQHFLTDVLVGAAVGTMSGLGVPWLLHYRGGAQADARGTGRSGSPISIHVAPGPLGLAVFGEF